MATVTLLVTYVRSNLEESTASYYADTEIKEWLDAAQLDVIKRIPPSELTDLHGTATATASSISLPSDYVAPISLVVSDEIVPIVMADSPLNDDSRPNPTLDVFGLLSGTNITLPASAVYTLYYITRPTDITGLTTTAPDIPEKYQYALVLYATYEGLKKDKLNAIAERYRQDYFAALGIGGDK